MRVIAGTARRLSLKTVPGMDTRPTQDRIKETLFNMLQFDLPGVELLDLFAGSGGIGIEALSRGAAHAVFVDNSRGAAECIRENLKHTGFMEQAELIQGDYMLALSRLRNKGHHFGLVFMDPPYGQGLERKALSLIKSMDYVGEDSIFVLELGIRDELDDISDMGYEIVREKLYKTNKHVFLRLRGGNEL